MKKITAFLLIAFLFISCLPFAGCGENEEKQTAKAGSERVLTLEEFIEKAEDNDYEFDEEESDEFSAMAYRISDNGYVEFTIYEDEDAAKAEVEYHCKSYDDICTQGEMYSGEHFDVYEKNAGSSYYYLYRLDNTILKAGGFMESSNHIKGFADRIGYRPHKEED